MKPLSSTDNAPLVFRPKEGDVSGWMKAPTGKIGWIRTLSNRAGAKFDLVIRDALGREKIRKEGCMSDTREFGELVNLPTQIGEDLEVVVENIRGAEEIIIHVN